MVQAYGGRLARVHMVFYDYRNSFFETGIHIEGFNPTNIVIIRKRGMIRR
jgi:hypothetical protein